jgi:hypothetical protein
MKEGDRVKGGKFPKGSAMHCIEMGDVTIAPVSTSTPASSAEEKVIPQSIAGVGNNPHQTVNNPNIKHLNTTNLSKYDKQVVTPVRAHILQNLLSGYDKCKSKFLCNGISQGFHLNFQGPREHRICDNLISAKLQEDCVHQKLQKEISCGRIAGPFPFPPFQNLQCSPIGLVPKKEANEFRLIHHLSYPHGFSINDHIPDDLCSVSYTTIDDAVRLIKKLGPSCLLAKTDIASAFRILPVHPTDYELLGIIFKNEFYFDKCLPMGCSISCSIFECFSTALEWIACSKFGIQHMLHILDDFLFLGPPKSAICGRSLSQFMSLCQVLGVPIKNEKTVGPSTTLTFLGIELDTLAMEARLPLDKVDKIKVALKATMKRRKVTLRELQSVIGLLNFACCVVVPGRAFLRRLINLTKGVVRPHHRIRLNREARLDLSAWNEFIDDFNGKSLFLDDQWQNSEKLCLYTDASGKIGYGAIFDSRWFYGKWEDISMENFHITFKEFFPIVVAMELWGDQLANRCILFYSDNSAVVDIINKTSSKDRDIMCLVRRLVLTCLRHNIMFSARHIPGSLNILPDLLSRLQVDKFKSLAPYMDPYPVNIPERFLQI